VVAGDLTTIYRRLLVHSIAPQQNLTAQMALVDEAQALIRYPSTKTCMLLHMDGTNLSIAIPDATNRHSVSTVGSTTVTTATAKFGQSTSYAGGSGWGLTTPDSSDWDIGIHDFAVDMWLFTNNATQVQVIWSQGATDGSQLSVFHVNASGQLSFLVIENGSLVHSCTTTGGAELTVSTWTHVALERYNGNFYIYNGGVLRRTTSYGAVIDRSAPLLIGTYVDGTNSWNGAIDEFRWSRVARYKGVNFTPPVAAYTVD
jgi:hypothetical protein